MNGLKAACWAACHGRGAGAVPRQDCVASRGRRRVQRGLLQKNSRQSGNNKHLFVSDSLSTSSKTLCCVRIILCKKTIYNPRARPIAPTAAVCSSTPRHTVGQIHQKCKETLNWCDFHRYGKLSICELSYLAFLLCGCLGVRGRTLIKSKMLGTKCIFWVSRCLSFFTWRFLNILGCSGPLCAVRPYYLQFA